MSRLDALATRLGIEERYRDARGQLRATEPDTQRRLLAAMGVPVDDEAAIDDALERLERADWSEPLPPAVVARAGDAGIEIPLVMPDDAAELRWQVALEEGGSVDGEVRFDSLPLLEQHSLPQRTMQRRRLALPSLPWGYHRLRIEPCGAQATLIVTPGQCWLPPEAASGVRLWGVSAQLYLLRSQTDWGIGDFGDLRRLVELLAHRGADVVGVNPLHAMFVDNPEHASPYSPLSRRLLNVLNIDVPAAAAMLGSGAVRTSLESDEFAREIERCRSASQVQYAAVAQLKLQALQALWAEFRARRGSPDWQPFDAFRRELGEPLELDCLFTALREFFAAQDPALADWHAWPQPYRDRGSAEVARFADEHRDRIEFHVWLQWIADRQLADAAQAARSMAIGLYRDLAVGADRSGAETWVDPVAVVSGAHVGAPPDVYNQAGQDWGLPPFDPHALRNEGYRSFIELVRANMRHAGGLRIDHVMALEHLYWVPQGEKPTAGAYVRYPLEDLVGILALESHRHRCLVVGEDLGTVPEGFRERMQRANILSYRVLFFENDGGRFFAPDDYPPLALAVAGSHDLPTLRAWWLGSDIDLRERLGLFPNPDAVAEARAQRDRERERLLDALRAQGLLRNDSPSLEQFVDAAHAYLAATRSFLAVPQLDDVTGETEPVNVPATSTEHPNWRRRLSVTVDALATDPRLQTAAAIFGAQRGRRDR